MSKAKKSGKKPVPKKTKKQLISPRDPSKPIANPRWEKIAQQIFAGKSQTEAYLNAGFDTTGRRTAEANCAKLLTKGKLSNTIIRSRIEWLKTQEAAAAVERNIASKEELAAMLSSITRARHSDFLTMSADGVWMHDIGPETLNQAALKKVKTRIVTMKNGESEVSTEKQYDEIELEGKVMAAAALAKLMGYNEVEKVEHSFTGNVTMITNMAEPDPPPKA